MDATTPSVNQSPAEENAEGFADRERASVHRDFTGLIHCAEPRAISHVKIATRACRRSSE